MTSNGSRYSVNSICPICSALPPTQLPNSTDRMVGKTPRIRNTRRATKASSNGRPAIWANQDLLVLFSDAGVQQHDDEDEQHHHRSAVDNHLRHGNELSAEKQIEDGQRAHDADQRQST